MSGRALAFDCPFPALLGVYVPIIVVGDALMYLVPRFANVGMPAVGPLVAAAVFGVAVETLSRKSTSCPWLGYEASKRVIIYLLLFVIGALVVGPAVVPSRDVLWILRVPFLIFAVAGIALLRIHKRVDHGEVDEAGVPRALVFASRVPVYLLASIAVFLVLMAVLNVVSILLGPHRLSR